MKNKKKANSYSGQPKFCIPVSILQLIKPRPPILENWTIKKTPDRKVFKKISGPKKIYAKLRFRNFSKKQFFLSFNKQSFSRTKNIESCLEKSLFFKSFNLKLFVLKLRNFFPPENTVHHWNFFKKITSRLSPLPNHYKSWYNFLKKRHFYLILPIRVFISNKRKKILKLLHRKNFLCSF